jgi:hypothetical protein
VSRLTDEELNAIEGQCDGFSMLILNPAAQRDVRAMLDEIRERRAADLSDEDRDALRWAVEMAATAPLNSIGMMKQQRAVAVVNRLLGAKP